MTVTNPKYRFSSVSSLDYALNNRIIIMCDIFFMFRGFDYRACVRGVTIFKFQGEPENNIAKRNRITTPILSDLRMIIINLELNLLSGSGSPEKTTFIPFPFCSVNLCCVLIFVLCSCSPELRNTKISRYYFYFMAHA